MLTLDLTNAPRWHDLAPGVSVRLCPLTTALMVATRADPEVESLPDKASDETRAMAFAKALARRAVLAWEGIGDADGNVIDPRASGSRARKWRQISPAQSISGGGACECDPAIGHRLQGPEH